MPYSVLDDRFPHHPRIIDLGDPVAAWVHTCGIVYCNRYLTDGFIPGSALPTLSGIPIGRRALARVVAKLVAVELWKPVQEPVEKVGWRIHDWHETNLPATERRLRGDRTATQRTLAGKARARSAKRDRFGRYLGTMKPADGPADAERAAGSFAGPLDSSGASGEPALSLPVVPTGSRTAETSKLGVGAGEQFDDEESEELQDPAATVIGPELAEALTDDQAYLLAKASARNGVFRQVWPGQFEIWRKEHGDNVLTEALRVLVDSEPEVIRSPVGYLTKLIEQVQADS